jgi:hypothetical protein
MLLWLAGAVFLLGAVSLVQTENQAKADCIAGGGRVVEHSVSVGTPAGRSDEWFCR